MMKKNLYPILFSLVLAAFTLYVVLDSFVITRVYGIVQESSSAAESTAEESTESESTAAQTASIRKLGTVSGTSEADVTSEETSGTAATASETVYEDENIRIVLAEYRVEDTSVYVADVTLSSPEYLQTALARNAYGKNVTETTSEMAEAHNAILAINGDYYGAQESGYVLRNGVLYRNTAEKGQEDLVIYEDGSFEIVSETEVSAEELLEKGARQILSFGPALVTDGEISVTEEDEVGKAMASNPRTAIGVIDELHYLFVVSDGRTEESEGLSLYQLASFMESLGANTAYNLDGGGSSAMVVNGTLINNPTTGGNRIKERSVSDIVYIGY